MTIKPRQPAPPLEFPLLAGGAWRLSERTSDAFQMIVVYRGLHCPWCKTYLNKLDGMLPEFARRGISVVTTSMDVRERAETARTDWQLPGLEMGYGLSLDDALAWDLFISRSVRDAEPAEFAEPGLFLTKADGTLFYASVGNAPFGRPSFDEVLRGVDFAIENKRPARGEAYL
jgi:peroxiredoxin